MTDKISFSDIIARASLVLFAVFLQVQITVLASPDYLGLRINSADILLPVAGLLILISLLLKRTSWPQWQKPFGYWAPALLSAVIVLAILNGYHIQGAWSSWAIINKGMGWCVLMAYLAMGAWFAANKPADIRDWFLRPFMLFLCVSVICEVTVRILFNHEIVSQFTVLDALKVPELSGFMANRNAFAFLYLSTLTLSCVLWLKDIQIKRIELFCFRALWALLPVFFVMNASRSSLLILVPLVLFIIVNNWRFFALKILPLILIGLIILPITDIRRMKSAFRHLDALQEQSLSFAEGETGAQDLKDNVYIGDSLRLHVITDSLTLYKQHPVTGVGIGSVYAYQKTQDRKFTVIIDNTPLWVFVEMGPLGFLAFAGVFFSMIFALHRKSKEMTSHEHAFAHAVIFVLIGFGLFSLFHEILYSRFLWVFLGMSLASPALMLRRD